MKLQISYFKDTDTLSIWNGEPAWSADDVAENLIIDLNASGSPVGLTLEHAAELSLPVLLDTVAIPESEAGISGKSRPSSPEPPDRREDIRLEITYHAETDILWLGSRQPTPNGDDIAEYVTAFFDDDDRPNAVMIEHAAELLLPILTGQSQQSEKVIDQPTKPDKATASPD